MYPNIGKFTASHTGEHGIHLFHATEVVVTLSKPIYSIIKEMEMTSPLDEDVLQLLEQDERIANVWTYQELVNSSPSFVSFNRSVTGLIVEASDFFPWPCISSGVIPTEAQRHKLPFANIVFPSLRIRRQFAGLAVYQPLEYICSTSHVKYGPACLSRWRGSKLL